VRKLTSPEAVSYFNNSFAAPFRAPFPAFFATADTVSFSSLSPSWLLSLFALTCSFFVAPGGVVRFTFLVLFCFLTMCSDSLLSG
jgi:hypothetical protein